MGDNASYYTEGEVVVQGEEEVDENYDPTDFLHNLGQPQEQVEVPLEQQQEQPTDLTYDVGDQVTTLCILKQFFAPGIVFRET